MGRKSSGNWLAVPVRCTAEANAFLGQIFACTISGIWYKNAMSNQNPRRPDNANVQPTESVRDALARIERELRELGPLLGRARRENLVVENQRRARQDPLAFQRDRTVNFLNEPQLAILTHNQAARSRELSDLEARYPTEAARQRRLGFRGRFRENPVASLTEPFRRSVREIIRDLRQVQEDILNEVLRPEERLLGHTGESFLRLAREQGDLQGLEPTRRLPLDYQLRLPVPTYSPAHTRPPSYNPPSYQSRRASAESNTTTTNTVSGARRAQLEQSRPPSRGNGNHL
jgi:hypothetical protein